MTNSYSQSNLIKGHVYWSARDLKSLPIGNHHFILIVFANRDAAEQAEMVHAISFNYEEVGSRTTYFMTLGGFLEEGSLVFQPNNPYDVKSVREFVDPDEHKSWWKPDLDLESHMINPLNIDPIDRESSALINRIILAAKAYQKKEPVKYNLLNENCACWVNTLLKSIGFSQQYRHKKGDFFGVDWGEEDEIDINLFIGIEHS